MRIAVFHELHAGGARRAANELASQLKKRNSVDLYTTVADFSDQEKTYYSSVHQLPFLPKPWTGKDWRTRLYKDTLELIRLFMLHHGIAKKIDRNKYDIALIHPSQHTQSPFLLKFLQVRSVYYCQEPLRIAYEAGLVQNDAKTFTRKAYMKVTDAIKKGIDKENIRYADFLLANSAFTRENIKNVYNRESAVCYLGVDAVFFHPVKIKKIYDAVFVGSKTVVDGYNILQSSLKMITPKLKLYTIQSGRTWKITDRKLHEIYASAKMTLCLARNEPFGLIPLESMACGTPVVALNEGGYKESVKHRRVGLLVEADPVRIANAIGELRDSREKLEAFGKAGRHMIEKSWTWEAAGRRLEKILQKYAK